MIEISLINEKEKKTMAKSKKQALEQFKTEAAKELGINLGQNYNGDLTSKQAGSIGGRMVKKMVEDYENRMR